MVILEEPFLLEVEKWFLTAAFWGYEWNAGFQPGRWGLGVKRDPSGVGFHFGPLLFRRWR